jgi:hypothetical protein
MENTHITAQATQLASNHVERWLLCFGTLRRVVL